MAGIRQTFARDGSAHPKWKYWYRDWKGERVWKTGSDDPEQTLKIAEAKERREQRLKEDIDLGIEKPPTSSDLARARSAAEIVKEYIAWGTAQGGRDGRPWARSHIVARTRHLNYWLTALNLQTLADFENILPRVEQQLREYRKIVIVDKKKVAQVPAGKTLGNILEAIHSLCIWAKQRGYLARDPLDGIQPFKSAPLVERRAMEATEIRLLLENCKPYRRLLYEVVFCTGLRANELRQLTPAHLDVVRGGVILDAAWTKNRKKGFQPLPLSVVGRLQEFAAEGTAARLYEERKYRGKRKHATPMTQAPADPLLWVPTHPARELERDLKAAGLTKYGPGGKADFHACRVAYITMIDGAGGTVFEAQKMARHSDPRITANVYGKTRDKRLHELAESVGSTFLPSDSCATGVQRKAAGAEGDYISNDGEGLENRKWSGRRDLNTSPHENASDTPNEHSANLDRANIDIQTSSLSSTGLPSVHQSHTVDTPERHEKTRPCATDVQRESLHAVVESHAAQMNSAESWARLEAARILDDACRQSKKRNR